MHDSEENVQSHGLLRVGERQSAEMEKERLHSKDPVTPGCAWVTEVRNARAFPERNVSAGLSIRWADVMDGSAELFQTEVLEAR
jgi:hypothetical protein